MSETAERADNRRKSPDGVSTNDLILSSYRGANSDVFPDIIRLYVIRGSSVADVTYGRGVFWKGIPKDEYVLYPSDLSVGVDCRVLPYSDASMDCVVFDPPYMASNKGSGRVGTAHKGHQNFEEYYANNVAESGKRYHEAVLDLYFTAAVEAFRVLRVGGTYIVKCQDEVCANQQRLTHVELIVELQKNGWVVEDLFVITRTNKPGVSRILVQAHARKNHSYFLVFRKPDGKKRWKGIRRLSNGIDDDRCRV